MKNDVAAMRLLAAGATVNTRSDTGLTALHVAALRLETPPLLHVLLQMGADRDACDASGLTPLDYAEDGGNTEAVHMLLAAEGNKSR
jgi:ankyrin repeat protein